MNRQCWLSIVMTVVLLSVAARPLAVVAQGTRNSVLGISQHDLNGDGMPDLTVIECSFATAEDRVYVYDGGNDMRWEQEWDRATDFVNDTWIFDVGRNGNAQLIIQFAEEDGRTVAYIYDDQNGDGNVDYTITDGTVVVRESQHWSMKVESNSTWLLADGFPNQNLRFVSSPNSLYWSEVIDGNHDGVPDQEVWNLFEATAASSASVSRDSAETYSGTWVNLGEFRPTLSGDRIFWPFLLGSENLRDLQMRSKFSSVPFVAVDWNSASVKGTSVGWTNSGYPIEHGYFIANPRSWRQHHVNVASFENPMAYYDLANDRDGYPELHIRQQYHPPFDPYYYLYIPEALNEIRYSWNQQNATGLYFDYKLGLFGSHEITDTVSFGSFGLVTVPHNEFPAWVTSREWPFATFFQYERGYNSSEGIYDWGLWWGNDPADITSRPAVTDTVRVIVDQVSYMLGEHERSPASYFKAAREGGRGEYRFSGPYPPLLYFSPVDGRLHLAYAEGGIWNLGDNREIRVANLNNDAYIDQWTYIQKSTALQPVTVTAQLNVASSHLFLTTDGETTIKQSVVNPSVFETLPPRNHDEWVELGSKLDQNQVSFAPEDFSAMIEQFPGSEMHIAGGTIHDYRRMKGERFRFLLHIQPGYRIQGRDLLGLEGFQPGRYVVVYENGKFAITPATPPDLVLSLDIPAELTASEAYRLQIQLSNAGLEDARNLTLIALAREADQTTEFGRSILNALSGESVRQFLDWQPATAGKWEIVLRVEDAQGTALAESTRMIEVSSPPTGFAVAVAASAGRSGSVLPWVLVLVLLASAASLLIITNRRESNAEVGA